MAEISEIVLPSGQAYDIKDAYARQMLAGMGKAVEYLGTSTTPISDGSSVSPIIIGDVEVTPQGGNITAYGSSEYVWSDVENKWREFGSTGTLKALAFKDEASASFVPAGTVSAPSINVQLNTTVVKPFGSAGTLPSCTLPTMTATVSGETLTLGWQDGSFNAGTLPTAGSEVTVATGVSSAAATAPTFSGSAATITVK